MCDAMSKWRKFAFVRNDYEDWLPRVFQKRNSFDPNFDYHLCPARSNVQGFFGGALYIELEDEKCM